MRNVPFPLPGINPGCDRRTSVGTRPIDPHRLEGRDRRAWEESIFINADLKGSRLHLVRVLLEEFCWGKCWCFPGNELLARKCGLGTATINRCLRDLAGLGVIRIVNLKGRRRIVFCSHPHAAAYLIGLGIPAEPAAAPDPAEVPDPIRPDPGPADPDEGRADQDDQPADRLVAPVDQIDQPADHSDRRILVVVNPGGEANPKSAHGEISSSGSNEPTREIPPPRPRDFRGLPDLAAAPIDDPVIAAELACRARARDAALATSREEIIASVLGGRGKGQDRVEHTDGRGVDSIPASAPWRRGGDPGAVPIDAEAATIAALSKLGPGATRAEVLVATARLTILFGDPKSRGFYRGVVNDIASGTLPARVPEAAVRFALGPDIRHPARAFVGHVQRCRAASASRRAMAGARPPTYDRAAADRGGAGGESRGRGGAPGAPGSGSGAGVSLTGGADPA